MSREAKDAQAERSTARRIIAEHKRWHDEARTLLGVSRDRKALDREDAHSESKQTLAQTRRVYQRFPVPRYFSYDFPTAATAAATATPEAPPSFDVDTFVAEWHAPIKGKYRCVDQYLESAEVKAVLSEAVLLDASRPLSSTAYDDKKPESFVSEVVDGQIDPFLLWYAQRSTELKTWAVDPLPAAVAVAIQLAVVTSGPSIRRVVKSLLAAMTQHLVLSFRRIQQLCAARRQLSRAFDECMRMAMSEKEKKPLVAVHAFLDKFLDVNLCRIPRFQLGSPEIAHLRVSPDMLYEVVLPQLVASGVLVERKGSRRVLAAATQWNHSKTMLTEEPYWEFDLIGIATTARLLVARGKIAARLAEQPVRILAAWNCVDLVLRFPPVEKGGDHSQQTPHVLAREWNSKQLGSAVSSSTISTVNSNGMSYEARFHGTAPLDMLDEASRQAAAWKQSLTASAAKS